jgi:hypothetical protein
MSKPLTREKAAEIREAIDRNIDRLDIDAARMGVRLTGEQKTFVTRRLKSLVKQGSDPEKLKAAVAKKTIATITDISKWTKH